MNEDILFLSIKPKYAEKIYNGDKNIEIRKSRPRRVSEGSKVVFYETSPKQAVTGVGEIRKIEEYDNPYQAIRLSEVEMNSLLRYVNEGRVILIYIGETVKWEYEVKLNELRQKDIHIPMSYSYISEKKLSEIV